MLWPAESVKFRKT